MFHVRELEWEVARRYFAQNPRTPKLSRKNTKVWKAALQEIFHEELISKPLFAAKSYLATQKEVREDAPELLSENLAEAFMRGYGYLGTEPANRAPSAGDTNCERARWRLYEHALHSFERINTHHGEPFIVATDIHRYLEEGAENKVKLARTKDGREFVKKTSGLKTYPTIYPLQNASVFRKAMQTYDLDYVARLATPQSGYFIKKRMSTGEACTYKKKHIRIEPKEDIDLYDFLEAHEENITFEQACFLLQQILASLYKIHEAGIIHADLKLENILLTFPKGTRRENQLENLLNAKLRLTDFGHSLQAREDVYSAVKISRERGTQGYTPKSQESSTYISGKTDVYAVGKIAEHLFDGFERPPKNLRSLIRRLRKSHDQRPTAQRALLEIEKINAHFGQRTSMRP